MLITQLRPQFLREMVGNDLNKEIIRAVAKNPKTSPSTIILHGSYGSGKCVLPGTRVATSKGYVPIETLYSGEVDSEGFAEYKTTVETRYGLRESSHFFRQESAEVLKLNLSTGYQINGTPEHRVLAFCDNRVDLFSLKEIVEKKAPILFPREAVGANWTHDPIKAYLWGLWLGDGFYRENSKGGKYGFCGTYEQVSRFKSLSGWTGKLTKDKRRSDLFALRCWKRDSLVFQPSHSWNKYVPEEIFCMDIESRIAFVQGLLETDGCINTDGDIEFTFKSEELVKGLNEILLSLGVVSHLGTKSNPVYGTYYRLRISCRHVDSIGLVKNCSGYDRSFVSTDNFNVRNVVELDGAYWASRLSEARVKSSYKSPKDWGVRLCGNLRACNCLTERSIRLFSEKYPDVENPLADLLGYDYVTVTSVETCTSTVYDLSVPGVHEFYAQGTYNHNTTTARLLAKALNCEHFTDDLCGKCPVCGADLNACSFYTEYDAATVGNVDTIKDLRDSFFYSVPGMMRVIVIDEAHLITKQAQGALLKVFEDAPPSVKFVLPTTDPDKLLPTIVSRSLTLEYTTQSTKDVADNIKEVAEKLNVPITDEVCNLIAIRSKGHMRNAHMLLDKYNLIGEQAFLSSVKSSTKDILKLFVHLKQKNQEAYFSDVDSLLTYPNADLVVDFQDTLLKLLKTQYGLVTDEQFKKVASFYGRDVLKLVKICTSEWVLSSFSHDTSLQTALLALFQMYA